MSPAVEFIGNGSALPPSAGLRCESIWGFVRFEEERKREREKRLVKLYLQPISKYVNPHFSTLFRSPCFLLSKSTHPHNKKGNVRFYKSGFYESIKMIIKQIHW